jgi:N-acetylmuramoyl-L-alanine amidase
MRKIDYIVIHATASREGKEQTVEQIRDMHVNQRKFRDIGYHWVVYLDGSIHKGRGEEEIGAHVTGFNKHSIGIAYVGGCDVNGKPKDTRTEAQKIAIRAKVAELKNKYPNAQVKGHRDFSPDLNKNGKIERHEWIKACPSWDVETEL